MGESSISRDGNGVPNIGSRRRGGKRLNHLLLNFGTTILLILIYYMFSIGLTFYQKDLFKDFKFPLTVVIFHLCIKFILAGICRSAYTQYYGSSRVILPWSLYSNRVFPPGIAAGLDIGLSQWSLEFITITLYTMSKSTSLLFILFFAIIFKLEEIRWSIVILVFFIAGGLFMFTYKYTQFNLFGFMLVITASLLSGLRWTLSQMVMQKDELGLSNPIDMVYHIQPWMMLSLLPLTVLMEGSSLAANEFGFHFYDVEALITMWSRILLGAVLAFLMEVSEYLLICFTSSLTLSIAGVAKEVATLSISVYYTNETLSIINQMGLVFCIFGISLHVAVKAATQNVKNQGSSSILSLQHSSSIDSNQNAPLLSDLDLQN